MNTNIKSKDANCENTFSFKGKIGLTTFDLKLIAVVTMLIDHVAALLIHSRYLQYVFRSVGRISFPIFAFLIVEGFFHTSNKKRYAQRLAIFALLSEIPYDLAFQNQFFELHRQNIFFTLLIGLLSIWGLDNIATGKMKYPEMAVKTLGYANVQNITRFMVMVAGCAAGYLLSSSYTYAGVFLMICFYIFHEQRGGRFGVNVFFNVLLYGGQQSFGVFSAIPIEMYNGKPGNKKWKWFFYAFYPVHLLILVLIRIIK